MAIPNSKLIQALKSTALKLKNGANYQWGHMGACNCGNLAQELTSFTKAEIHKYAMERHGDWNEQIIDYCPSSGYPMDLMISKMLNFGLSLDDLAELENLSNKNILAHIPFERREKMNRNVREDVILYLNTWALILENELNMQELNKTSKKLNVALLPELNF
ncbi:hypothetical protein [Algoriphagus pacificus]|uniref:Uncharacterized protein n=1 Tax=Algoriphagus pacificus TaxID=2811234 RepID=A0ABS3CHT4_9BACT|nr:hypothetical protein [Algoriphagus pacificus]MBN7816602.1 hypothetical protein [Algoriphagus pacificus]